MLTDARIRAAKPRERPYRLGDAGQLYLFVTPAGGRLWRMNYSFGRNAHGKPLQKTLSFGAWPAVSLAEARRRRDEAKRLLAQKRDPGVVWKQGASTEGTPSTFRQAAEMWFEHNSGWSLEAFREQAAANGGKWKKREAIRWAGEARGRWTPVHAADVHWSLERDVFPAIGDWPIGAIKPLDVRGLLQKVEARGSIETAHRLRQRISAVFVWAISCGLSEGNPAASLGATLKPVPVPRHQPAIIDEHVDEAARLEALRTMLADCEALPGRAQNKLALRLLALTAVRPGELAGARWEEFFDLDGTDPTWVIPAARMKGVQARRNDPQFDHPVPLARQAVEILVTLHRLTGRHALLFPSERHVHRQISENTLRAILIRAGYYQRHVPHGFRAAFSTIMNERAIAQDRPGDRAVIDLMLAHTPSGSAGAARAGGGRATVSAVEAAYNRAAYMPRRRALAQEWADLLLEGFPSPDELVGGPIR
jgi:integrase